MAINPGDYNEMRTARTRTIIYIVSAAVVAVMVLAAGYMWIVRGREAVNSDNVPPQPPAVEATPEAQPATPAAVKPTAEPNVAVSTPAVQVAADTQNTSTVSTQIAQAMALLNQQPAKVIEARDRLNELLPMARGQEQVNIKQQLSVLADKWLFGKLVYPGDKLCAGYKVNPGDLLANIGKQHNVPYEILMQINNIEKPELLQAGVAIKVINGPFNTRVSRSAFTMDLYLQNTYVKSFTVGLGKSGMETPTGRWRVKEGGKLVKPIWTDTETGRTYHPEDPDYPLGSRWIALEGIEGAAVGKTGFAIHGTKDPQQIGAPGSRGCIRLHNGDAVFVYNLMMPGQSLVDVVE